MVAGDVGYPLTATRRLGERLGTGFGRVSVIILVFSTIVLLWLGIWSKNENDKALAVSSAKSSAMIVARSLDEQTRRMFGAVDQTLLYIRDIYVRAPQDFNMADWQQGGRYLSDTAFQVSIVDRDGFLLTSNMSPQGGVSLKDREHIRVHLERSRDELFISKPVFGRVSQKWSIQFTRRITSPDGSFAGVIVASLDPAALSSFYSTVLIGQNGTIFLMGDDGGARAGAPYDPEVFSQDFRGSVIEKIRLDKGEDAVIIPEGTEGLGRLLVSRRVVGYPLTLIVGQSLQDVYLSAEADGSLEERVGILATIWMLGFLVVIMTYQRNLERAKNAAEAGTRARAAFLATMSHEIRTPLNGVIGLADLLAASRLDSEQQRMVGTLKQSASHLLALLNDILVFSKLEADRVELERVRFSIREVTQSTISLLSPAARRKGVLLDMSVEPHVPALVKGDPGRIRQILLNLVGNAIKFTDKGSIRVLVNGRVLPEAGKYKVEIAVVDTGCGIAPEMQSKLFRPFSQVDGSISRRYGGTGLGLAISQRLAQEMGGEISLVSDLGKGATFCVSLVMELTASKEAAPGQPIFDLSPPMTETPASSAQINGVVPPAPASATRMDILVAEDNRTNQFVIAQMLRLLGHNAVVVSDGRQALEAVQSRTFDLVLMDVMMPEMDGLEATRAIRALPGALSRVPIFALTANSFESDETACLAAGMNAFLTKPVTRQQLDVALRRVAEGGAPRPAEQAREAEAKPPRAIIPREHGFVLDIAAYRDLVDDLGEEMARSILKTFLEETDDYLVQISNCLVEENRALIRRLAHSLKGSARTIGFSLVSDLAKDIEERSETAPVSVLSGSVARLGEEYAALRERILQSAQAG